MRDVDEGFALEFVSGIAQHLTKSPVHDKEAAFRIHLCESNSDQIKCLPKLVLTGRELQITVANGTRQGANGDTQLLEFQKFWLHLDGIGEIAKIFLLQFFRQPTQGLADLACKNYANQAGNNDCPKTPQQQFSTHAGG